MLEQALFKTNFVGRDGFVWWIGQIAPQSTWVKNAPESTIESTLEERGFGQRYKVRIMGYHTARTEDLPDEQLPWATVMYPPTAGRGGRNCTQTANLSQGTFVFGFFLDGEDAQQPVIMGCLGYNDYTAIAKNLPSTGFIPFSGFEPGDAIPAGGLRTSTNQTTLGIFGGSEVNLGIGSTSILTNTGVGKSSLINNKTNESAQVSISLNSQLNSNSFGACSPDRVPTPVAKPTNQELPMSRMQQQIRKAIQDVQQLQRAVYNVSCGAARNIANLGAKLNRAITQAAKWISASMKSIYRAISSKVMEVLNQAAKAILSWIPVNYRVAGEEAVLLSTDNLACLFKRLIATLLGRIRSFIMDAVKRVINVPRCFVEQFIANFLGTARAAIAGIVGSLQDSIAALADVAMGAIDIVSDVLSVIDNILSFLTCNVKPRESTIEAWSILNGESITTKKTIDNIIERANNLGSQFASATDFSNIEDAISEIDFSDVFDNTQCDTSAILCGPPIVEFFGSSGAGAAANLVIGSLGEVIGVDILSFGDGNYGSDTKALVNDQCGKGTGATLGVRVTSGGDIEGVDVIDPGSGYIPSADGSEGGDGRTWRNPNDTTVFHDNGTFDVPIPPGYDIEVETGDTIDLPAGTCVVIEPSGQEICNVGVVEEGGKFTTPYPSEVTRGGPYPTSEGSYPVLLYMCGIVILNSGFGYTKGDEVVIEPSMGAEAVAQFDNFGRVIGIKVTKPGEGFVEWPKVYIKSDTGYNAELNPKLCIDRIGDEKIQEVGKEKIISVVDCVGRVGDS